MMNGFNPQPFITTTTSNNVNDDYFEEDKKVEEVNVEEVEEVKAPPQQGKFIFYGYYQNLKQIMTYEPNQEPIIVPFADAEMN